MTSAGQLRVLLVDDQAVVRRGLKSVLEERAEIVVVGEAGTARESIELAQRLQPDVVVMDLRLPDGSGIEACREIHDQNADAKVLILATHVDEDALFSAVLACASGYLLKDLRAERLQDAIITVGSGGSLLDPLMTTQLLERLRRGDAHHPADDRFLSLLPSEVRVFEMVGDGLTNGEIAAELKLSERTVKNYVSSIYSKLDVKRRSEAAQLATERRLREQS
jgi:two-component system response regulator DevR